MELMVMERPTKRKRVRPSHRSSRRIRALERDAARRALNGDGACGSLPPLPTADGDGDDAAGGCGTLFGHPYGALPHGNVHLVAPPPSPPPGWHPDVVRRRGLGPLPRRLNDEQLLLVLSYVDGPTLAGGVVACSRFLYVAGHHEELWRDLVLRRWGEGGFKVPSPDDDLAEEATEASSEGGAGEERKGGGTTERQRNSSCWKDIYAHNFSKHPPKRHTPIPVAGIYSDAFFRSFLCRSFSLRPSWLAAHTVPTLPRERVGCRLFLEEHEEKNVPLLIKGASRDWPALRGPRRWTVEYLLRATEGRTFRATSGAAPLPAQFSMADYVNYCASSTEEAPLYLFDRTFAAKCPRLLEDFDAALQRGCRWWSRGHEEAGHDLFSVLGEKRRPDYQWLIVGPKRCVLYVRVCFGYRLHCEETK